MLAMKARAERLRKARVTAGFASPADAVEAFGWNANTYKSHENGVRGLTEKMASRYGTAFNVDPSWLLWGHGRGPADKPEDYDRRLRRAVALASKGAPPAESLTRGVLAAAIAVVIDRRRQDESIAGMSGTEIARDILATYDMMIEAHRLAGL